jgi:hypothetical protein
VFGFQPIAFGKTAAAPPPPPGGTVNVTWAVQSLSLTNFPYVAANVEVGDLLMAHTISDATLTDTGGAAWTRVSGSNGGIQWRFYWRIADAADASSGRTLTVEVPFFQAGIGYSAVVRKSSGVFVDNSPGSNQGNNTLSAPSITTTSTGIAFVGWGNLAGSPAYGTSPTNGADFLGQAADVFATMRAAFAYKWVDNAASGTIDITGGNTTNAVAMQVGMQ